MLGGGGWRYIELSDGVRTPADGIETHMRRRAMVGLAAKPPRLSSLEKACLRGMKAVHQLALGAALYLQAHARCYLALRRHFYEHAPGRAALLRPGRAAAFGGSGAAA